MLRGIPSLLSPELMKILMEMGHGDELVLADGNFPCFAYPEKIVRCDGHGVAELLDAILRFMPLDRYVENPTILMQVLPGDPYVPKNLEIYREIGFKYEKDGLHEAAIDKLDFYARAKKAYAVVVTSETELYANIILRKGVL